MTGLAKSIASLTNRCPDEVLEMTALPLFKNKPLLSCLNKCCTIFKDSQALLYGNMLAANTSLSRLAGEALHTGVGFDIPQLEGSGMLC